MEHGLILLGLVIFGWLVIFHAKNLMSAAGQSESSIAMAGFILAMEFLDRGYQVIVFNEAVKDNLPFHLCGIGVFLSAGLLIYRGYALFEVMYFWGLVGATQAIVTSDIPYPFPHFLNITFFLSHWMIIVVVFYMMIVYGYRPRLSSLWKSLLYLNVYMLLVLPVNLLLNTNYLFLRHKPETESLLDILGSWPWYILSLEAVAMLLFFVFYLPVAMMNRKTTKSLKSPSV